MRATNGISFEPGKLHWSLGIPAHDLRQFCLIEVELEKNLGG